MLMGGKVRGRGPIEYPECEVHSFGLDIKEPHTLVNPIKPWWYLTFLKKLTPLNAIPTYYYSFGFI